MDVYLVWHVSHHTADGVHRVDGEVRLNEDLDDDAKLLGCFSSRETASDRVERARSQPGFQDEPNCFIVDRYTLDADTWSEGFVTV